MRRAPLRWVLAVVVAVLILAVAGWVLLGSPWLRVKDIDVDVTAVRPPIQSALNVEDVSRVVEAAEGRPLVTLDAPALVDRLERLPRVADATVERDWPAGLQVSVVERVPVAAVPATGGWSLVDASGESFATAAAAPEGVPAVQVDIDRAGGDTVAAVVSVLEALPEDLRATVDTAGAQTSDSIRLTLAGGAQVVWGGAEDSEVKVSVLAALMKRPAAVYDVSAPGAPATR